MHDAKTSTMAMRVVKAQVSETEYGILAACARARKTTIQEAVRGAIRRMTIRDEVDPNDPLFRAFPVAKRRGKHADASERRDYHLYGRERGSSTTRGLGRLWRSPWTRTRQGPGGCTPRRLGAFMGPS